MMAMNATLMLANISLVGLSANPDKTLRIYRAAEYPKRAAWCVACFIGLVSLCHITLLLLGSLRSSYERRRLRQGSMSERNDASHSHHGGVVDVRRLPKAVLNASRALAFRWTLNIGRCYTINVAEVALTVAYIILLFTWTFIDSNSLKGVKYDPWYWANRAGLLAVSQATLTTLLGIKNNPLSSLIGLSGEQLNFFHRMTARVLCVLMWVHGSGRIWLSYHGGVPLSYRWVQCGITVVSSLTVLVIFSVRPIREKNYECFRVIHFLFLVIFMIAGSFHAQGTKSGPYIWPSVALWGIDRLLRGIRLIVFNFSYFKPGGSKELNAEVDVLSSQLVRIRLCRPRHFFWMPAQYAYLTVPSIAPFQSHPFTISSIRTPVTSLDECDLPHGIDEELPSSANASVGGLDDVDSDRTVTFIIRVRNGFTRRLMHLAERETKMQVFLDGPYGTPPSFIGFNTVIFVAGGSGITFTLPLFLDLVLRAQQRESTCRRVVFVWVVRESNQIGWLSNSLSIAARNAPPSLDLDLWMHVTAPPSPIQTQSCGLHQEENTNTEEKFRSSIMEAVAFEFSVMHIRQGRPDITLFLGKEIEDAEGDVFVNVCGPDSMVRDTQHALRMPRLIDVLRGGPAVSLHIERFGDVSI